MFVTSRLTHHVRALSINIQTNTRLDGRAQQETGLLMAEAPRRIEQNGLPTALLWHPLLGSDYEDRLVNIFVLKYQMALWLRRSNLPCNVLYAA